MGKTRVGEAGQRGACLSFDVLQLVEGTSFVCSVWQALVLGKNYVLFVRKSSFVSWKPLFGNSPQSPSQLMSSGCRSEI